MTQFLSKAAIKHALFDLHETVVDSPFLGGAVLVREPTAMEKTSAVEASRGEDADAPADETIARAFILQRCILDPESGEADSTGRVDPRTRRPLFSPEEVNDLINTREVPMSLIYQAIARLGAMLPDAFRDGDQAPDDTGTDTGASPSEDPPADSGDPG